MENLTSIMSQVKSVQFNRQDPSQPGYQVIKIFPLRTHLTENEINVLEAEIKNKVSQNCLVQWTRNGGMVIFHLENTSKAEIAVLNKMLRVPT